MLIAYPTGPIFNSLRLRYSYTIMVESFLAIKVIYSHLRNRWQVRTPCASDFLFLEPFLCILTSSCHWSRPLHAHPLHNSGDVARKPQIRFSTAMPLPIFMHFFVRKLIQFSIRRVFSVFQNWPPWSSYSPGNVQKRPKMLFFWTGTETGLSKFEIFSRIALLAIDVQTKKTIIGFYASVGEIEGNNCDLQR